MPVTPFAPGHGITTLGIPADSCGGHQHTASKWKTACDATILLLDKLQQFPDVQIRHCLLRYCLDGCRVMHLLRGTDSRKAVEHLPRLTHAIRKATDNLAGGSLSDAAWAQATLPISKSGLGISDPTAEAPHARIAALGGLQRFGREKVGVPDDAF